VRKSRCGAEKRRIAAPAISYYNLETTDLANGGSDSMGLRFRRSVKLAPGVRLNFSGSGFSWTIGPKGASVGIGKRGAYLNTGIPGTGFYSRQRIGGGASNRSSTGPERVKVSASVDIDDDGTLSFKDANGNALSEYLVDMAKRQQGEAIRGLIQAKCDEINEQIDALGEIHLYTPRPDTRPRYEKQEFRELSPLKPVEKTPGLLGLFFRSVKAKIERENQARELQYSADLAKWQATKLAWETSEQRRRDVIERGIYSDVNLMASFLEANLQSIVWPRETMLSIEILEDGKRVFIDVDLPELEHMPSKMASVPKRGYKLSVKDMSAAQVQRLYMRHVHGVGFRVIGEAFSTLPNLHEVVISGYSQRADRSTGHVSDEYLYSVRVTRPQWSQLNFDNLRELDVVEVFALFDLSRKMTKTGIFKAIEPYGPDTR
jgi:hypothetical protein